MKRDTGNKRTRINRNRKQKLYKKWSFWLVILLILIVVVFLSFRNPTKDVKKDVELEEDIVLEEDVELEEDIAIEENLELEESIETAENLDSEESTEVGESERKTYTYEDFKGTFATFTGEPYQTPIEMLVYIDDYYMDMYIESDYFVYEIVNRSIEGNVLSMDWYHPRNDSKGTLKLKLDDTNEILISMNTGVKFYSVTDERVLADDRIQKLPVQLMEDGLIPKSVEAETTEEVVEDILDTYDIYEIDYARILMMTNTPRIFPLEPTIYVQKFQSGDPIFRVEGSATYPKNVTRLSTPHTGATSNHDVYSLSYHAHGDGYITIYPSPSEFDMMMAGTDEELRELAQSYLDNAETIYVDPATPEEVIEFIESVEFIYK